MFSLNVFGPLIEKTHRRVFRENLYQSEIPIKKQKGFTLVEIAIVLVIVGLLIGGVMKGQEMINNTKLKRIQTDNAGIAAVMLFYRDRYMQIPGDDGGRTNNFQNIQMGSTIPRLPISMAIVVVR